MLLKGMTLEPDPIEYPGNVTISAELHVPVPLSSPQKVSMGMVEEVLEGRCGGPYGRDPEGCMFRDLWVIVQSRFLRATKDA